MAAANYGWKESYLEESFNFAKTEILKFEMVWILRACGKLSQGNRHIYYGDSHHGFDIRSHTLLSCHRCVVYTKFICKIGCIVGPGASLLWE